MSITLRKQIPAEDPVARVNRLDWQGISQELDEHGNALLPGILTSRECDALAALYPNDNHFRSRVVMERYSFGRGEYKYFQYPLRDLIFELRTALYPSFAEIANRWNQVTGVDMNYP